MNPGFVLIIIQDAGYLPHFWRSWHWLEDRTTETLNSLIHELPLPIQWGIVLPDVGGPDEGEHWLIVAGSIIVGDIWLRSEVGTLGKRDTRPEPNHV